MNCCGELASAIAGTARCSELVFDVPADAPTDRLCGVGLRPAALGLKRHLRGGILLHCPYHRDGRSECCDHCHWPSRAVPRPTQVEGGHSPDLESVFQGALGPLEGRLPPLFPVGLAGEGVLRICAREPPTLSGGAAGGRRAGRLWMSYVLIKNTRCLQRGVPRSSIFMKKKRGKRQVCAFALFLPFTYTLTHLVVSEITAKIFFGGWVLKEFKMIKQCYLSGLGRGRGSAES